MQRIILDIPDNKMNFFIELFKSLGIKKIKKLSAEQIKYADGLSHALHEVEEHQQGEKYLQNAKDFLGEI